MKNVRRDDSASVVESGFAIRSRTGGGYFDCNGLGESSLCGTSATCEVFKSTEQARESIDEPENQLDAADTEIVPITRCIAVLIGKPVEVSQ